MCGIAGLYRPRRPFQAPEGERLVRLMTDRLVHRGPDGEGQWSDAQGRCILGHRRLSIIDTSDAGRQPRTSNDGRWVITFNGEIYNFRELKPVIERAGGQVRGRTDTEVLVEALALWGIQALEKLDGMFAFAAYDTLTGDLILARDAFGEKPIYLMDLADGGLAFASELQALECLPGFDASVDLGAMGEVLCFQYIGAPRSIYRKVEKLRPGHWRRLTASGQRTSGCFYAFQPAATFDRPLPDLADELEDILIRSIRRRMIADVPLGAFLSGGVDSPTVCALLRRKLGVSISTYSVGFKDEPESEHKTARAFARHLKTDHHELIIEPQAADFLSGIGRLLDEPNADSSCLPTYLLSGLARRDVTVAIGGDGGDEMFGGYNRYFATLEDFARHRQGRMPDWTPGAGYYGLRLLVAQEPHVEALLGFVPPGLADHLDRLRADLDQARRSLLPAMRRTDVENYLPGAVLGKVDRMSMRHSLEVRTPYLNIELARFAERLPDWMLVRGMQGKLILREIARRYLPASLIDLPKRGFGLPMSHWARANLHDAGMPMLDAEDGRLAAAFGREAIKNFIASEVPSEGISLARLWTIAVLESWLRHHPAKMPELTAERRAATQSRKLRRPVLPQGSKSAGDTDDVSAVVLTTGEPTTQGAIDSLRRQTAPLSDIIVVRDVTPFHKAINAGAAQVKTTFFVQVDADMVLDDHCVAALRKGMRRDVGIVVGHLRDPLIGQVVGIKLFRTAVFQATMFQDSISPDTDFVADIARAGWKTVYVGEKSSGSDQWATYGEHRRDYSLRYTYRKYLIEGCRYRYCQKASAARWHFAQLGASLHPSALAAQIGLARGIFLEKITDQLGRSEVDDDFVQLARFLSGPATAEGESDPDRAGHDMSPRERFHAHYRLGAELGRANDVQAFKRCLERLNDGEGGWITKIALCKGLFAQREDEAAITADYQALCSFLLEADAIGGSIVAGPLDVSLDAATAYAAALGLGRFAMDGAQAGEYRADGSAGEYRFRATGRSVTSDVLSNGRPRIKAPFQPLGHFLCADPQSVRGIFWCLDLMRSGYFFVHVPTPMGSQKALLAGQFAKNCLSRVPWLRDVASRFYETSSVRSVFRRMVRRRGPSYRSEPGRILMISSTYNLGGSERQMLATASGLMARGYDVRMMALYPLEPGTPNIEEDIVKLGLAPHLCLDFLPPQATGFRAPAGEALAAEMSRLPRWLANKVAPVREAIRHYRPTVVHAWADIPIIVGTLAACEVGVPRVVLHQCSMQQCMRRYGAQVVDLLWEGYRTASDNPAVAILNNSAAGAADYERWLGRRPGTIRVLYNGIADGQVRRPAQHEVARFRADVGLSAEAPVVGTVMRFVEDKDPDLWLDTAAEIAKARPDVRFLIAGYGTLRDRMMERIETLGLRDRVVLAGAVTDVGLILATLDVFLLTSMTEGVPNVLIEAQAAGRPVVAADVGGVSEAVSQDRTGRVVRERSPRRLAEAVLGILGDVEWTARVRSAGPEFVVRRFGLDRIVGQLLAVYGLPDRAPDARTASVPPPPRSGQHQAAIRE
jgi:asparagine synthase (glutamine-hydrolysing)